jgi:hypothetical protein
MNTFLRIKLEASGWPENCRTQAEKDAYVEEIWQREGIRLDPTRIEFNPGLREVAVSWKFKHFSKNLKKFIKLIFLPFIYRRKC